MIERRAKMEAQAAQMATEQAAQAQSEHYYEGELVDDDGGDIPQGIPYKRGAAQNLKIFYESVIIDEDDDDYYDDEEYLDDEYDSEEYEEKAPNKTLLVSEDYGDESYYNKREPEYIKEEQEAEVSIVGNQFNSAENTVAKEEFVQEELVEEEPVREPVAQYTYVPKQEQPALVEEEAEEQYVEEEYEDEYEEEEAEDEQPKEERVVAEPSKFVNQKPAKQYDEQGREVKYVVETVEDDEVVKPARLVKLPNLVDYMISLNMSKRMKMNVCMLLLTAYHKYKSVPQEKTIVIACMKKMLTALMQG